MVRLGWVQPLDRPPARMDCVGVGGCLARPAAVRKLSARRSAGVAQSATVSIHHPSRRNPP
jgi:hypothetical protein